MSTVEMFQAIDSLYAQGKTEPDPFAFYYSSLRPHLVKYATIVSRNVMRRIDDHLITEMVDDLLMDLASFRGDSPFSAWARSRFHRRSLTEIRPQGGFKRKTVGDPSDLYYDRHQFETSTGATEQPDGYSIIEPLIVSEYVESLSTREQEIVSLRLEGYTQEEIANMLQITDRTVRRVLSSLQQGVEAR